MTRVLILFSVWVVLGCAGVASEPPTSLSLQALEPSFAWATNAPNGYPARWSMQEVLLYGLDDEGATWWAGPDHAVVWLEFAAPVEIDAIGISAGNARNEGTWMQYGRIDALRVRFLTSRNIADPTSVPFMNVALPKITKTPKTIPAVFIDRQPDVVAIELEIDGVSPGKKDTRGFMSDLMFWGHSTTVRKPTQEWRPMRSRYRPDLQVDEGGSVTRLRFDKGIRDPVCDVDLDGETLTHAACDFGEETDVSRLTVKGAAASGAAIERTLRVQPLSDCFMLVEGYPFSAADCGPATSARTGPIHAWGS